jgi:hypothetical protein
MTSYSANTPPTSDAMQAERGHNVRAKAIAWKGWRA